MIADLLAVSAVAVAAVVLGIALVRRNRRLTAEHDRRAALPETTELIILLLSAGISPTQAIRQVVPYADPAITPALDAVVDRLDRNHPLADALPVLVDHIGDDARPVVEAFAAADRYGLELAPVLDRLGADIRADRRRRAEADARRLSVTMSFPLVICILPAFVLLAIAPALVSALASIRGLDTL